MRTRSSSASTARARLVLAALQDSPDPLAAAKALRNSWKCHNGLWTLIIGLAVTVVAVLIAACKAIAQVSSPRAKTIPWHFHIDEGWAVWGIRGLTLVALCVALWYWYLHWRAMSLRSTLLERFLAAGLRAPAWIDLAGVDLSSFCKLPKDVDINKQPRLLWTSQTEAHWQELKVEPTGGNVRAQILAGPSGIGKSHIALLLALRCYAEGMPVLYVPDAGKLVERCSLSPSRWLPWMLDTLLLRGFAWPNADVAPLALVSQLCARIFPPDDSLMRVLNASKAVVVLDEHGHAYNYLVSSDPKLEPAVYFNLLMPNSYISARFVRCVFVGSNQAQFEGELNDTYRPCFSFVVPFTETEAELFLSVLLLAKPTRDTLAYYKSLSNFAPREMKFLAAMPGAYVETRRKFMFMELRNMIDKLDKASLRYTSMVGSLKEFFQSSTMVFGVKSYSFLDLGYVFRRGTWISTTAVPLCYPALLALLDLWRSVLPAAGPRLTEAIQEENGTKFEDIVWECLLWCYAGAGAEPIPCRLLGAKASIEPLLLVYNEYFCSTLNSHQQLEINRELLDLMKDCNSRKITALYRCPVRCADVDFFILHSDGTCTAIHSTLSLLTVHSPTAGIINIPCRFSFISGTLVRYVYVTAKPNSHTGLAGNDLLRHVRTVDAVAWFGKK